MEMPSLTHLRSPSHPFGDDYQSPRKTSSRASAMKTHVPKTSLDGPQQPIAREAFERNGQTDDDENSRKRNTKNPSTQRLEMPKYDDPQYSVRRSPNNPAHPPAMEPRINDTALSVSETHLDSGYDLDDYGISGIDDQAAAKHREIVYRTDFALSSEQCVSGCCDYSDVSCSDCESDASDPESFEVGKECGEARLGHVRLGGDGFLKLS